MLDVADFQEALVARPDPAASRRELPTLPTEGPGWFCMHSAFADASFAPSALRMASLWWPDGAKDLTFYAVSRDRRLLEGRIALPQLVQLGKQQRRPRSPEFDFDTDLCIEEWLAELCLLGTTPGMRLAEAPALLRLELAWHPQSLLGRHHTNAACRPALICLWHHVVAELDPQALEVLRTKGLRPTVGGYHRLCSARTSRSSRAAHR